MKKFQFSLEKMLNYKDSLLKEEKNKLLQIRARKNDLDMRIESARSQIENMGRERTEKAAHGISVMEMRSYGYSIENTQKLVKALADDRARVERQIEKQLAVVLGITQEVSGLEKLKEKQLEAYRYQAGKEEELVISELVTSKYIAEQVVAAQQP